MNPVCIDYHIHTNNTDDASNTLEEMAVAAAARGIREIAVTDHFVLGLPGFSVSPGQIEKHFMDADLIRARHGVEVRVGMEADFLPDSVREIEKMITAFDFDFVLGAAHFVDGCGLADQGSARVFFDRHAPAEAYRLYFAHLVDCIQSGLFDVMAHLDLPRKFGADMAGDPPFEVYAEHAAAAAGALARTGTGFEVNCRGFDHACRGQYPSMPFLTLLKERGVDTVTIGSDAHTTSAVGDYLDRGAEALRHAGFGRIATFQRRRRTLHALDPAPGAADLSIS